MSMKSMKLPKGADPYGPMSATGKKAKGPRYPWGLTLRLESEALKKLGMSTGDFTVGEEMTLAATVEITGVEKSESEGAKRETVSLQITALDLAGDDYSRGVADALKGKK